MQLSPQTAHIRGPSVSVHHRKFRLAPDHPRPCDLGGKTRGETRRQLSDGGVHPLDAMESLYIDK